MIRIHYWQLILIRQNQSNLFPIVSFSFDLMVWNSMGLKQTENSINKLNSQNVGWVGGTISFSDCAFTSGEVIPEKKIPPQKRLKTLTVFIQYLRVGLIQYLQYLDTMPDLTLRNL